MANCNRPRVPPEKNCRFAVYMQVMEPGPKNLGPVHRSAREMQVILLAARETYAGVGSDANISLNARQSAERARFNG